MPSLQLGSLSELAIAIGTLVLASATFVLAYWARRQAIEANKATQVSVIEDLVRESQGADHREAYIFVLLRRDILRKVDKQAYKSALQDLWSKAGRELQPIELLGSYYERIESHIVNGILGEEIAMPQFAFGFLMVWDAIAPFVRSYRNDVPATGLGLESLAVRAVKYAELPASWRASAETLT